MPAIGSMAMILFRLMQHRDQIAKMADALQTIRNALPLDEAASPAEPPPSVAAEEPPAPPPPSGHPPFSTPWLQESLNTLMDAGLEVDGDYGGATRAAVKEYQQQHGLTVDGWAGVDTMSSIWDELHKQ